MKIGTNVHTVSIVFDDDAEFEFHNPQYIKAGYEIVMKHYNKRRLNVVYKKFVKGMKIID